MAKTTQQGHDGPTASVNEVRLVGRVSREPVDRVLPSGDRVVTFRVIVPRRRGTAANKQRGIDAVECSAWTAATRRVAARLAPDDLVQVEGAIRRRFFRRGPGVQSMVEVEVASARVIRRAPSA